MSDFDLKKLLIDVFEPQKNDSVTILFDIPHSNIADNENWKNRRKMAIEWWQGFNQLKDEIHFKLNPPIHYDATEIENGDLPEFGKYNETNEDVKLEDVFLKSDLVLVFATFSPSAPMLGFIEKYPHMRVASMPWISKAMEQSALSANYSKIAQKCEILSEMLKKSNGATVKFATGHKCFYDFDETEVHKDDGMLHRDKKGIRLINLPSGETYCVPKESWNGGKSLTSGKAPFSSDNSYILSMMEKDLGKKIIKDVDYALLQVNNNMIEGVEGDSEFAKGLKEYFSKDPARKNIAEFGLGCNDKALVTGNPLEDEKAEGFHWAFGRSDHISGKVGSKDFISPNNVVHLDVIYSSTSKIKTAEIILHMKDGSKYKIWDGKKYLI
ncbi:hypothetical protein KKA47_02985 [bacterium]|nr:hypothetical protein [bacterium]